MSNNVVVVRRTVSYFLHFVWTKVRQDGSTGGTILWIPVQSKENHSSHVLESACRYHAVFRQQFHIDYRSQLLVPRRMRRHAVHHRLSSLRQCVDHQIFQRCVVKYGILIRGNLLRLHCRFLRLYASQHDFQRRHGSFTPKKQLVMSWRHKQTKRN